MSEKKVDQKKELNVCRGPFGTYHSYEGKGDFDKYYLDVKEREVFKGTGEKDPDTGEELGVVEKKLLVRKVDINEYLESQRDSVGVESYMKALVSQGEDLAEYHTQVDEKVNDFTGMPEDLAGVMLAGDAAKKAFAEMDPALKGGHTTIEGFLNSLTRDSVDAYIKGRIEALTPKNVVEKGD